ncbi:hypothetical protein CC1G_08260 [Coprinopsis cinerea okayama7|uniref:Extracellular membrane protein CFEM domain-containing protein n=1 Tax=Coprinopsis cinerea (strain Okayama-7 / 130 / ATCC MYA-4618 / FGSC 9003) TaxID=240176 RepID=A8PG09_COPC7|nr:hypothetical protein CC1G_08260 [Coprinopsis cinerea okayama7\|eukprot:XP_001841116.2 hypothetical protein CC1G_08260 [Coprinopsis cinerea okayama7\
MELTASFLSAVAVASTFVGTALSATTVPGCYAECIEKGAAAVNCAVDDIDCLRLASSQFTTITRECLDTNNCTSLTPGTPADEASITTTFNILSGLGLIDSSEVFSLADVLQVHQRDLTGLSRILPIDKRQRCIVRRATCVTSGLTACVNHCISCHRGSGSSNCVECSGAPIIPTFIPFAVLIAIHLNIRKFRFFPIHPPSSACSSPEAPQSPDLCRPQPPLRAKVVEVAVEHEERIH